MNTDDLLHLVSEKMGGDNPNLDSILNMMQSTVNNTSNTDNNSSNNNASSDGTMPEMPDLETIMRIKKIMDSMKATSNDPSINLLSSLKPYLKDEKKSKIDQYIKILNMSKAMSLFTDMGGDSN